MGIPPAPWSLSGECVVGLALSGRATTTLPGGLHPVAGPRVVVAARYDVSPVGPYLELALAQPARLGAKVGMCVTAMVVTTAEARLAGRALWGLPKELGTIEWTASGRETVVRWVEGDVVVKGVAAGPVLPVFVPFRCVQRRADGPVSAAARVRGRARLGRVEVSAPSGGPWATVAGTHPGAVVSSARLTMEEARRPGGGLRVPQRVGGPVPEPALTWAGQGHTGD